MSKATVRARHGSYLFQRPGSSKWYVRLRSPDKTIVKSLGTADKAQAEITALLGFKLDDGTTFSITAHKAALLAARPKIEQSWRREFEPGLHTGPDGSTIAADERELRYYNHNGALLRTVPNGGPAFGIVGGPVTVPALAGAVIEADFGAGRAERTKAPTKNSDDALFQTYLDHGGRKKKGIHGRFRDEAESVWALFKRLTDNKPLKDCDRNDGRKLVAHFQAEGLKSATIQKKITWLNAAVNHAIDEGKLKFNPFSSIAPDWDDELERRPLNDADMKACKSKLATLDKEDQLLFRILATTGMRISEAFEIGTRTEWAGENVVGEGVENGIRFCVVGHKTNASKRRVPFPRDVLPYLPKRITGPLLDAKAANRFTRHTIERLAAAASKRLNRFLRSVGIEDPSKVVHSMRHRAKDRLRAVECPKDTQFWLLGHDDPKSEGDNYGDGPPVSVLKPWANKIGF